MIKKIKIEQLKPGMYIYDLNCRWLDHPFLKNKFYIKDERTVKKISEYGIKELYIDTNKGIDVIDETEAERNKYNFDDRGEHEKEDQTVEDKGHVKKDTEPEVRKEIPLKEEIVKAREIKKEAKRIISDIMDDVRFGRPIKKEKVEHVVEKMMDSIFRNKDALVSLAKIKKVDEYTYMHSVSVCVICLSFGRFLGLSRSLLKDLGIGAILHDIGKIKIPHHILCSRGELSEQEYEIMKRHVEYGYSILSQCKGISETSLLVTRQHHERLNGSGYPANLKGDEISLFGKIGAISDVYDAMTSRRCYQGQFHPTEVMKRLYQWSGELFDSELVQKFIKCMGIYPVGTIVHLKNGFLAVVTSVKTENLLQPVVSVFYDSEKNRFVPPFTINLSEDSTNTIVGYDPLDRWSISIDQVI